MRMVGWLVGVALALFGAMLPARAQVLTNPVTLLCLDSSTGQPVPVSPQNPCPTTQVPSGGSGAGITPVVSASAESSHVLKNAAGNLYSVYATNLTATAGFLVVINATSAPVDGAITPLDCAPLPGNSTASINYRPGPPSVYSTGIVAVVTSATTCFTKTTGVITAFIHGDVK